jgi:hypothetical protein
LEKKTRVVGVFMMRGKGLKCACIYTEEWETEKVSAILKEILCDSDSK